MSENAPAKRSPKGHGRTNDEQAGEHVSSDREHQGGGPTGHELGAVPLAVTDVPLPEGDADQAKPEATTDVPMPDAADLAAPIYGRP